MITTPILVLVLAVAPMDPAPASSQECRVCHQEIYEQWERSWHARSTTNHNFMVAFRRWVDEGNAPESCLDCHAAASIVQDGLDHIPASRRSRIEEGVNCHSCHAGPDGLMVGPYESTASHPTAADPAYKTLRACVPCHGQEDAPCQKQVSSLLTSALRGRATCQSCHMPARPGPLVQLINLPGIPVRKVGDHSFPGAHDPRVLAAAIEASVEVQGPTVAVGLTNTGSGHSVPASPWRKLVSRVQVLDDLGRVVLEKRDEYFHGRGHRLEPRRPVRVTFSRRAEHARVRVRLYYLFQLDQPLDEADLMIDREFVL